MKRESKDSKGSAETKSRAAANVRAAGRYHLALPTMMWELGGMRDLAVTTETVNISRSGMFLSGQFPLQPGSMISFEVKLPPVGEQPGGTMVGQATVVRNDSAGAGRTGIGAVIHQCEVWPATRPAVSGRATVSVKKPAARHRKKSAETRSGAERRSNERRGIAGKSRRALALATERRRKARRAAAERRKKLLGKAP